MFDLVKNRYLIAAAGLALLNNCQTGIVIGWTSPVLPFLQGPNSTIPTTTTEGAWMATSVPLLSLFITPLAAFSVHKFGRKISLGITVIPFITTWILVAVSKTATQLICARAISGIAMAFSYTITPIYIGEIAPDNMRSMIGLLMNVVNNIGILWIYAIGPFVDLWLSSVLNLIPGLIFLVFYKFLPESPYYLVKKNKIEEAKTVLTKLRNGDCQEEFDVIQKTTYEVDLKESLKQVVFKSKNRRALFISVGAFFIGQFTGGITFVFYAHLIFLKAGDVSANLLSLVKAIMQLVSGILSAFVVENTGKRPLLMVSCIGSSLFMALEGIYFFMLENNHNVDSIWWLPLVSMILFNMSQAVALQPVPLAFLGELFDPNIKSVAVCISKTSLALFVFIVGELFQVISENFGHAATFFIFSVMGVVGLLFVVFFIPETRGKSLDDIQYYLEHKTFQRKNDTTKEYNKNAP